MGLEQTAIDLWEDGCGRAAVACHSEEKLLKLNCDFWPSADAHLNKDSR